MEEAKGRSPDSRLDARKRKKEDEDAHSQENLREQRPRAIGSIRKDCQFYVDTGLCRYGRNCRFNHPQEILERTRVSNCKYFRRGYCEFGSVCVFRHSDGAVPMRKGRTPPDLGPSESARRSFWRHETESRSWAENRENEDYGLRINETGQMQENLQQQQKLRDVEMQRKSHETESRFLQHQKRATTPHWGGSGSKKIFDERSPSESGRRPDRRHETESRSWAENRRLRDYEMQRRSHERESRFLQHQKRATTPDWGESESNWRFAERSRSEYPVRPDERDRRYYLNTGLCKFFLRGACKYGSACRLLHPNDRDGAEPVSFNVRGSPIRQDWRRTDWRASESDWGFDERRHETESSSRPEKRAKTIPDFRERDSRERFEDISQRRHEKDTSQISDEIVAGYKRARVEEQRKKDIEKQRREARLITEQIKPTLQFNEGIQIREALPELGFKKKEGDGF